MYPLRRSLPPSLHHSSPCSPAGDACSFARSQRLGFKVKGTFYSFNTNHAVCEFRRVRACLLKPPFVGGFRRWLESVLGQLARPLGRRHGLRYPLYGARGFTVWGLLS